MRTRAARLSDTPAVARLGGAGLNGKVPPVARRFTEARVTPERACFKRNYDYSSAFSISEMHSWAKCRKLVFNRFNRLCVGPPIIPFLPHTSSCPYMVFRSGPYTVEPNKRAWIPYDMAHPPGICIAAILRYTLNEPNDLLCETIGIPFLRNTPSTAATVDRLDILHLLSSCSGSSEKT